MKHISRVGEVFYYRLRVPRDLLTFFPRKELKRSLKTRNLRNAKRLAGLYESH